MGGTGACPNAGRAGGQNPERDWREGLLTASGSEKQGGLDGVVWGGRKQSGEADGAGVRGWRGS